MVPLCCHTQASITIRSLQVDSILEADDGQVVLVGEGWQAWSRPQVIDSNWEFISTVHHAGARVRSVSYDAGVMATLSYKCQPETIYTSSGYVVSDVMLSVHRN